MANTISTPSWREDQPWSIEQGLANTLATRPSNLAETMLTRYGIERQANQADYHDYMRAINALQAQNLSDARHDADAKLGLEAVKLGGTYQGAGRALATNSVTSPFYTGDTTLLDQGAMDNAAAKQIHDAGLGLGGAAAAGQTPESLANTANNVPAMRGSQFTVPSNVQAQTEANKGRMGAAAINAGSKYGELHIGVPVVGKSAAFPEGLTGSTNVPPSIRAQGPAAIEAWVRNSFMTPRITRAPDKTDYTGQPNPLLGGMANPPGTAAPPAAAPRQPVSGQTEQQAQATAMNLVGQLKMSPNAANRGKAAQIMRHAEQNGGKLQVRMENGKLVADGVNDVGQVVPYRLQ